jgi:hypothetical protein
MHRVLKGSWDYNYIYATNERIERRDGLKWDKNISWIGLKWGREGCDEDC